MADFDGGNNTAARVEVNKIVFDKATMCAFYLDAEAQAEFEAVKAKEKWLVEVFDAEGTRLLGIQPDLSVVRGEASEK